MAAKADCKKSAIALQPRDGIHSTEAAAALGQPFWLQTCRIAPPDEGRLIAYGHLVSGGAVLGK